MERTIFLTQQRLSAMFSERNFKDFRDELFHGSKIKDAAGENDDESSPREDCGFSFYDRKRSRNINKEEKNIWFLCKDCHPFKILSEKDETMENHCSEYPDHFQLFPDWYFSKFDLKIEDAKFNPSLQKFL